ncbi:hypothetical protein HYPGJ_30755 [Hyphomicrobium sp. GJ21]|uniref:hypothetical protein n=1 Tax=Hyphomicrobium sp. GJ21 TaxID=113574 RepID=UPI000622C2DC|nr:hypothetical protein [Hyphomicrobium sp. GJ21]CEJ86856.1 hypothetical protein HYPGJ_30755 [Hyphomicrobium sp. GJ21]
MRLLTNCGAALTILWIIILFRIAPPVASKLLVAPAFGDEIPKPTFSIDDCRASNDKTCVKNAWNEYKSAIVTEYDAWKTLLPTAQSGDADAANRILGVPIRNGWYVHNHWTPIVPQDGEFDIISFDVAEAVDACRTAIINLKFWLVNNSSDHPDFESDQVSYGQSARKCEAGIKKYHLRN